MNFMSDIIVQLFIFACKLFNRTTDYYNQLYNSSIHFQYIVWNIKYTYCCLTFQHMEPFNTQWTSKSTIVQNKKYFMEKYSLRETYNTPVDVTNDSGLFILLSCMMSYFNSVLCVNTIKNSELFIIKMNDEQDNSECYFSYRNDTNIPIIIKKSKAKFLSIEYKHPKMEDSIELTLNNSWFYAGNELFTPAFVLRALKYQSSQFIFDMNYTICFMDNDINCVEFGSNKYVFLTDDGYELIENDTPIELDDTNNDSNNLYDTVFWKEHYAFCCQFLNDIS